MGFRSEGCCYCLPCTQPGMTHGVAANHMYALALCEISLRQRMWRNVLSAPGSDAGTYSLLCMCTVLASNDPLSVAPGWAAQAVSAVTCETDQSKTKASGPCQFHSIGLAKKWKQGFSISRSFLTSELRQSPHSRRIQYICKLHPLSYNPLNYPYTRGYGGGGGGGGGGTQ